MELAHMGSLYNVLRNPSFNPTWESTFEFGLEAAEGMALLHGLQPPLLHRDLKTLNLMVTNQMIVKVGDFGLSIFDNTNTSGEGGMTGTAAYLAPEILEGAQFTIKADVYAFAIVLWELVNSVLKQEYEAPFEEYHLAMDMQILFAVSTRDLRPSLPPSCPQEIIELFNSCWNKDPELRPDFPKLVSILKDLQTIFRERKRTWDSTIGSARLPVSAESDESEPTMVLQQNDESGSAGHSNISDNSNSSNGNSNGTGEGGRRLTIGDGGKLSFVVKSASRGNLSSGESTSSLSSSISNHRARKPSDAAANTISADLNFNKPRSNTNS